jgi:hypothetical protein
VRVLRDRPWASSLLLVPDELTRVFGAHDQVILAPGNGLLLSLPTDMPSDAIANIAVDMEMAERWPLFLDPFVLLDGVLGWGGVESPEDWEGEPGPGDLWTS